MKQMMRDLKIEKLNLHLGTKSKNKNEIIIIDVRVIELNPISHQS